MGVGQAAVNPLRMHFTEKGSIKPPFIDESVYKRRSVIPAPRTARINGGRNPKRIESTGSRVCAGMTVTASVLLFPTSSYFALSKCHFRMGLAGPCQFKIACIFCTVVTATVATTSAPENPQLRARISKTELLRLQ